MHRPLTLLVITAAAATLLTASPADAAVNDGPCSATATGDFNGDGFSDLAIGVPEEDVGAVADAGAVNIIYGTAAGLSTTNNQFWQQDTPGVHGVAEAGDRFGACLAAGNFDGDLNGANRIDDLAIGVPGQDVDGRADAGAVAVIYGSKTNDGRLNPAQHSDQIWTQNFPGVIDVAEIADNFGAAVAAGDFNGDGRHDLAVGVPREDVGTLVDAGAVHVIYGTEQGLHPNIDQQWHQDITDIEGTAESGDRFGASLASGLFNDDGRADLAIGVPGENEGTIVDAGLVNVIYGAATRMSAAGDQVWSQNSTDVADDAETNDFFGRSLAAGDFGGTAQDELAIGVPGEDLGAPVRSNVGAVSVIAGSASGLVAAGGQFVTQDAILSTTDTSEPGDKFGSALAAGNFGDGGHADLAIGTPSEDDASTAAGAVDVVYGTASGLNLTAGAPGADFWTQNSANVEGTAAVNDNLGSSLTVGNFNGNGVRDLVIGVPLDDEAGVADAGVINVIYGTGANGLDPTVAPDDQIWHQGIAGILGDLEANDMFGSAA